MADPLVPEGFVPYKPETVPTGFMSVEEAKTSETISKSLSADLAPMIKYEGLNKFFTDIPGFSEKGSWDEIKKGMITSILVSLSSDEESADIMLEKFPGSKILKSEDGGTVFVSPEGDEFALDAPGLDADEVTRALTEIALFAQKAGRTALGAMGQAGTKQTAIEAGQSSQGGEFNTGDIAATAAGAGVGHFVSDLLGRGVTSLNEGAEQIVKTGESLGSPVLTSDVVDPEAASAITRFITSTADKYPGIGTATERAGQRSVRNQIGADMAREFHITDDMEKYPGIVAKAIEGVHVENVAKASKMRKEAIAMLDDVGIVPIDKTMANLKSQIAELERIGMKSDKPVVANLQDALETLPKAENFADLAFVRSRIIRMTKEAERGMNPAFPAESASRLKRVKAILDKDMQRFANSWSKEAGNKWKKSNELFFDEYSAYDKTILAKIAGEGDFAAEKLMKTLSGTDSKSLKQLYNQMDEAGLANSKAAIIQNVLDKSGYFIDDFKPFRLATELNKPAIKVFFKGDERRQLDGLARYIRATKESMTAKDITPTGIGLAQIALAPISIVGKMYQSPPMRDMLMRLSKVSTRSKKGKVLIDQIRSHIDGFSDEITAATATLAPEAAKEVME